MTSLATWLLRKSRSSPALQPSAACPPTAVILTIHYKPCKKHDAHKIWRGRYIRPACDNKESDRYLNEHEQVNERSVAFTGKATKGAIVISVKGTKITARLLAMAMKASFNKVRGPRRSVKSLTKDGSSLENVEISGDNIGA